MKGISLTPSLFKDSEHSEPLPPKGGATVTRILLAWQAHPQPHGTSLYAHDLSEPDAVVQLFKQASRFRAQITAEGWRFLWGSYGLGGLLEINRQAAWFDPQDDHDAAEQIFNRSLIEGYDPVSGHLRGAIELGEAASV
jgi:hypothetical protein